MSKDEGDPNAEDRSKRIAQLEDRLNRKAPVGVMPPVALLALALAGWVLYEQRADVAYYFSDRDPILLGVEGNYLFDRAVSNRYATLHGGPTVRAPYAVEGDKTVVFVGVQGSPLIVKRNALPTESWSPGKTPPPPDPRSFTVSGRLLSRADAYRYRDAFEKHDSYGELKPTWILIEGARPGGDVAAISWVGLVLAFAGVNVWLLLRGLLAAVAARSAPQG